MIPQVTRGKDLVLIPINKRSVSSCSVNTKNKEEF